MTVLLVLLTFALFIALDYVIELRKERKKETVREEVHVVHEPAFTPALAAEPVWVAGYQLPEELHFHRGHTWARLLSDDTALIGLDDFARKLIGPAKAMTLPSVGAKVSQGDGGFKVVVNGKSANFLSPVDGQVLEVNPELEQKPCLATDDPYGRGWVMKVRSSDLAKNLRNLLSGSLARSWMEDARRGLDLQLMALSGSVLQDGGEPVADFARHLSEEEWKRLVGEFLLT
jgi:glycine cleavage system H lipoate-binding protein